MCWCYGELEITRQGEGAQHPREEGSPEEVHIPNPTPKNLSMDEYHRQILLL